MNSVDIIRDSDTVTYWLADVSIGPAGHEAFKRILKEYRRLEEENLMLRLQKPRRGDLINQLVEENEALRSDIAETTEELIELTQKINKIEYQLKLYQAVAGLLAAGHFTQYAEKDRIPAALRHLNDSYD